MQHPTDGAVAGDRTPAGLSDLSEETYPNLAALRAGGRDPQSRAARHSRRAGALPPLLGSNNRPHTTDTPLTEILPQLLKVKAQAYGFEAANPRHEHEWMVWKDVKLPDGKILIPGLISQSTNVVEHPELVAWRIKNFASVVGKENLIVGVDCGFSQYWDQSAPIPPCSGPNSRRRPKAPRSPARTCGVAKATPQVLAGECGAFRQRLEFAAHCTVGWVGI